MHTIRPLFLLVLAYAMLSPVNASATMYHCRDHDGRTQLRDTPCPANAKTITVQRPRPATHTRNTRQRPLSALPQGTKNVPVAPPTPRARSVDTLQLALLRAGMTMQEITKRLGHPERVIALGNLLVYRGRGIYETLVREKWVYPGSRGVGPTLIIFQDGRLLERRRIR